MDSDEFAHYMAYDRLSPISDERADYRAASIAMMVGRLRGEEGKIADYLINWGGDTEEESKAVQDEISKNAEAGLDYIMTKHNATLGK